MKIIQEIAQNLEKLKEKELFRETKIMPKFKEDFSSNDYLSLGRSMKARLWLLYGVIFYGKARCSSKYLNGYSKIHKKLEETVANTYETDKSLIFSSGYLASIGVLQGICNSETIILADRHIHASWVDSSFAVKTRIIRYHHNDVEHLEKLLLKYNFRSKNNNENKEYNQESFKSTRLVILTETVFSMQGTVIDLQKYVNIAKNFGAIIVVDNAHGFGVVKQIHTEYSLLLHVGTFSKACGGFGGYVCGNKVLVQSISNFGRTQIYSTVLPEYLLFYNMMAFKFAYKSTGKMLLKAKKIAEKYCLEFKGSAILIKEFESINAAYEFQKELIEKGVYVPVIRQPTVPKPIVRFSICL